MTALVLIAATVLEERGTGGSRAAAAGELVWATGGIDARPGGSSYDVVAAWNQLHPNGPAVRIEALPNAPDDQHQELALRLADQSHDVDVMSLDLVWTAEFAANKWLANLDSIRDRIEDVSLHGAFESAMWDGSLYGAPNTSDAPILYFNKQYVNARPGSTWDQIVRLGLEAARKHRSENPNLVPFVGQGAEYEGMVVSYLELLHSAGGDLFEPDCSSTFEEGPALRALEFMRQAWDTHFFSPDIRRMKEEEAREAFQAGDAVFMRNWPYAYDLMEHPKPGDLSQVAGRIGMIPLPTFDGKGTEGILGGHNLAVNAFSRNPEAAKDFVRFVSTSHDIQYMLGRKHSMAPTMTSVYRDLSSDPLMKLLGRILPNTSRRPSMSEWNEISEKIQKLIFPAYTGKTDPSKAIRDLHAFIASKAGKDKRCS